MTIGNFEDIISVDAFELLLSDAIGFDGLATKLLFITDSYDVNASKHVDIKPDDVNKFIDYLLNTKGYKSALGLGLPVFYADDSTDVDNFILALIERRNE